MRILISGGGVAGTVAAMALQRAGFQPEIFEAYRESAGLAHGVYLTVAVNGLDALRVVGADHVVTSAGFPSRTIDFFSGTGRQLGTVALGPARPDGSTTHTIRRTDLYGGLYREVVARGIPVHHEKRLVGASLRAGGGVSARFADGSTAEGDLLVGADGVHSPTRTLIDPAAPLPRYTGLGNTGGFAAAAKLPVAETLTTGDYRMIWGRRCFFGYLVSPAGDVWWFANPPSRRPVPRGFGDEPARRLLLDLASADRTPMAAIIRATPSLSVTNQYELPAVPTWHNGAMVVIGDAAHAVSPSSGQGASLAAEDAVVLANCLRSTSTVQAGLDAYERLRRDRVERIVKWGSGMNNTKRSGLTGWVLREVFLPFMLRNATAPEEMERMSWMFDYRADSVRP